MSQKPLGPENKFSGWTDREILGLNQDRLKLEHYASVLVEIIQEVDTPLTVGIFGSWGSGRICASRAFNLQSPVYQSITTLFNKFIIRQYNCPPIAL